MPTSDGTNIIRSKPDSEVFLKSADFVSMPYENCLVVEDAISGVEAAHAAGMKAAAVGDAAENKVGDYIMDPFPICWSCCPAWINHVRLFALQA